MQYQLGLVAYLEQGEGKAPQRCPHDHCGPSGHWSTGDHTPVHSALFCVTNVPTHCAAGSRKSCVMCSMYLSCASCIKNSGNSKMFYFNNYYDTGTVKYRRYQKLNQ